MFTRAHRFAVAMVWIAILICGAARSLGQAQDSSAQVRQILVRATGAASTIKNRADRDSVLAAIAARYVTAGELDDSLPVISALSDRAQKTALLGAVVQKHLDNGDLDRASAAATRFLQDARDRHWYRVRLQLDYSRAAVTRADRNSVERALQQAASGEFALARGTAERITDRLSRYEAFFGIVQAQAKAGDFDGALSTAERISVTTLPRLPQARVPRVSNAAEYKAHALRFIALAQADSHDFDGATKTVERIGVTRVRESAFWNVMEKQAASGDAEGAMKLAQRLTDPLDKFSVIGFIAASQLSLGEEPEAESTLSEALTSLTPPDLPSDRLNSAIEVGRKRLAESGANDGVAWAGQIGSPFEKSAVLVGIADGLLAR